MDKIRINNLKFYTHNGVLKEEKRLGQQLEIDIELQLSLRKAGETDDVSQTVNYAEVNEKIAQHTSHYSYDLIEGLASGILDDLESTYSKQLKKIIIRVRKYSVPMPSIFDNIEIEMEREF
ncbi:dihydroneopterin aldolase [Carnobacterium gallinarum]|uniref:dihydroneopterin aldolase n=1 Tax=Carnobacterium gallinarum TaxID=2749 RepID=UPI0005555D14|nr:dihydroneopterin aldolase [Carnobacterium gallinarum]